MFRKRKYKHFSVIGMNDDQLLEYSKTSRLTYGLSPWARFETERTSFGRHYRKRSFFPTFLPLMLNGDHGPNPLKNLGRNEIDGEFLYLTWNLKKQQAMESMGLRAIHVEHPWTKQILKNRKSLPEERIGSLLFWPHSIPNYLFADVDHNEFVEHLNRLPNGYKPITVCVSSHDIQMGIHKQIRKHGYNLVTVGDICNQRFVDNFYSLLRNFKYSIGPTFGSHAYYSIAVGVPYLLVGKQFHRTKVIDKNGLPTTAWPGFKVEYREEYEKWLKLEKKFHKEQEKVTQEALKFVEEQLGFDSKIRRLDFSIIVWKEFFINLKKALKLYAKQIDSLKKRITSNV